MTNEAVLQSCTAFLKTIKRMLELTTLSINCESDLISLLLSPGSSINPGLTIVHDLATSRSA